MVFWRTGDGAVLLWRWHPTIVFWVFTLDNRHIRHFVCFFARDATFIGFLIKIRATVNAQNGASVHLVGGLGIGTPGKVGGETDGTTTLLLFGAICGDDWIFIIIFIVAHFLKIIIADLTWVFSGGGGVVILE